MLAESRAVPGQVGVFADAWSPPSSTRSSPRIHSLAGVAVFQDGDLITAYGGVRFPSRAAYDESFPGSSGVNRYLWESSSGASVIDGRPSLHTLHYSSFINEGFHSNNCVIDDEYLDGSDITHRLLEPAVISMDTIRHAQDIHAGYGLDYWTVFASP